MCGTLEFASPTSWDGQQQKTWTKDTETDLVFSNYKCWNSKLSLWKLKRMKRGFYYRGWTMHCSQSFFWSNQGKNVCWKRIAVFSVVVLIQVIRTLYGLKIKGVGLFFLPQQTFDSAQDIVFCHATFVCQNVLFLSLYLKSELLSYLGW